MPKKAVKLQWTNIQREIASKIMEGLNFEGLVNAGYTRSLVSKIMRAVKAGQRPPAPKVEGEKEEPKGEKREPDPSKGSTSTTPIIVGKITITPENWGMTQYGAILILDTYNKAKRDISYGGTIGDFICDICEFYRRILNYTEVEYGRQTGDGGGGIEEDGPESTRQLAEG